MAATAAAAVTWGEWLWSWLDFFGLRHRSAKILFLGLDAAGKTSLLHVMRGDPMSAHQPTIHPTMEELEVGNVRLRTFDLGGHAQARRVWTEYFTVVDAVVFMVDATAPERFEEARGELEQLIKSEELASRPFLVLGNKIDDTDHAVSATELRSALQLETLSLDHPMELCMCSVTLRQGYREGFQWLSTQLPP